MIRARVAFCCIVLVLQFSMFGDGTANAQEDRYAPYALSAEESLRVPLMPGNGWHVLAGSQTRVNSPIPMLSEQEARYFRSLAVTLNVNKAGDATRVIRSFVARVGEERAARIRLRFCDSEGHTRYIWPGPNGLPDPMPPTAPSATPVAPVYLRTPGHLSFAYLSRLWAILPLSADYRVRQGLENEEAFSVRLVDQTGQLPYACWTTQGQPGHTKELDPDMLLLKDAVSRLGQQRGFMEAARQIGRRGHARYLSIAIGRYYDKKEPGLANLDLVERWIGPPDRIEPGQVPIAYGKGETRAGSWHWYAGFAVGVVEGRVCAIQADCREWLKYGLAMRPSDGERLGPGPSSISRAARALQFRRLPPFVGERQELADVRAASAAGFLTIERISLTPIATGVPLMAGGRGFSGKPEAVHLGNILFDKGVAAAIEHARELKMEEFFVTLHLPLDAGALARVQKILGPEIGRATLPGGNFREGPILMYSYGWLSLYTRSGILSTLHFDLKEWP